MNDKVRLEYSKIISAVRFPLIVSLVFVHFDISEIDVIRGFHSSYPVHLPGIIDALIFSTGHLFAGVRVACFFLISGYLFFLTYRPTLQGVLSKFKNRVNTLLIPFVIWNLIYLAYSIFSWYLHVRGNGYASFWEHDSLKDLPLYALVYEALWERPACGALWYIRELMLLVLLSPLLFEILRTRYWRVFVAFLGILWLVPITHSFHLTEGGCGGLFLYTFGGGISIHEKDFLTLLSCKYLSLVFVIVAMIDILTRHNELYMWVHTLTIIVAMVWIFHLAFCAIKRGLTAKRWMTQSSFFIYAIHQMLIGVSCQLYITVIEPITCNKQVLLWFLVTTTVIGASIGASEIVRKTTPRLHRIITGGRE